MRYFLPALSVTVLLAAIGCGRQTETGISVDRALKPLVPPDTKVLAGVELDKLKRASFYQRHEKELDSTQLSALTARIGLDPRRDISDVLVAWNGKQSLLLAHASFNTKEVEERLGALGGRHSSYKHRDLIGTGVGGDAESLVFLKKGVAAAGNTGALRAMIDIEDSGAGGIPAELAQQLGNLPKIDQIWAVSRGGLPFAEAPMRSDIQSALSNFATYVSSTAVGIGIDTGAHVQAEITCASGEGAQRVRDALRGGIGLARLTTKDNEADLLRLYDSIHVDQDHQLIHVRADLPPDLIDKLLARLPQLGNRFRQPL